MARRPIRTQAPAAQVSPLARVVRADPAYTRRGPKLRIFAGWAFEPVKTGTDKNVHPTEAPKNGTRRVYKSTITWQPLNVSEATVEPSNLGHSPCFAARRYVLFGVPPDVPARSGGCHAGAAAGSGIFPQGSLVISSFFSYHNQAASDNITLLSPETQRRNPPAPSRRRGSGSLCAGHISIEQSHGRPGCSGFESLLTSLAMAWRTKDGDDFVAAVRGSVQTSRNINYAKAARTAIRRARGTCASPGHVF